jgi:transposase
LIAIEIARKNPDQVGFAVNPRRWVVERFFAWIGRNRRLAKDFEPRGPPASVVLAPWQSMIAAEGLASRPTRSRLPSRARGLSVQSARRRARRQTSGKSSPKAANRVLKAALLWTETQEQN